MSITNKLTIILLAGSLGLLSGCGDDEDSLSTAANGGGSSNTGSLGDSTPTGRITADGFYVLYDPAIADVFDDQLNFAQTSVVITAFAEDLNDLVEISGQEVNFRAEWGGWLDERDSCVMADGFCSVTWISGDPSTAPGSCRVAITAYTNGEESFFDSDDDGVFDAADQAALAFNLSNADLQEPFLDINGNGSFDSSVISPELKGELIDIINFDGTTPGAKSGDHDAGNTLYDGSRCAADNAAACSGRESMIIHARSTLLIQSPFNEGAGEDRNFNGITDEENINNCGTDPAITF
jgi:hypothetical protein